MELLHSRFDTASESTVATLRDESGADFGILIEDQYQRGVKVPGKTCFPIGRYPIELRVDSPKFEHFYDRWDWFRGLPWIKNIPNYSFVYYHPGTTHKDSEGCPLTGKRYRTTTDGNFEVAGGTSREAFEDLCLAIYAAMDAGEEVWVKVSDDEVWE